MNSGAMNVGDIVMTTNKTIAIIIDKHDTNVASGAMNKYWYNFSGVITYYVYSKKSGISGPLFASEIHLLRVPEQG